MDIKKIKEFIDLAKKEGVSELKYEEKDFKIGVNFLNNQQPQSQSFSQAVQTQEVFETPSKNYHEITSPFVGTFYGRPAPGKPTFIKVGDSAHVGQTLCILEAMKIMNEIESDVSGEVVEICVEDESLVEYGQVLFKVKVK